MGELSELVDPKMEEVILPGFRFHPTDEELVGFYLKRKVQQRPFSIELIKQLDIYKYDPWDLPKLASTGEKEWYFFCPRDRKYKNSVRPNRVTGAGFWKATGTDRPIYSSSQGSKCIGLKKSLVFYQGRAAKGVKTQWMMHEFRLPPSTTTQERFMDNHIPPNDSWAICRIFKKANSSALRSVSHSWVSPWPETTTSHQVCAQNHQSANFTSPFHFKNNNSLPFPLMSNVSSPSFSPSDVTTTTTATATTSPSYNSISHNTTTEVPLPRIQALPTSCGFSASQCSEVGVSSLISTMPTSTFEDSSSYFLSLPEEGLQIGDGFYADLDDEQWGTVISSTSLLWDPFLSGPTDISSNYSITANECHI